MHEFSLAQSVVDTVFEKAAGRAVEAIYLDVGIFSGVSHESLLFYLQMILEEKKTPLPKIEARLVDAQCRCECGREYEAKRFLDACPACGGYRRTVLKGMDCFIDRIEVTDGS